MTERQSVMAVIPIISAVFVLAAAAGLVVAVLLVVGARRGGKADDGWAVRTVVLALAVSTLAITAAVLLAGGK